MEMVAQQASRGAWRARQTGPWRGALIMAALLGVLASVAGCGSFTTPQTNPPASKVGVGVIVLDHESVNHTPSDTTTLIIRLGLQQQSGFIITYKGFFGADPQTLVCDGVVMREDHSQNLNDPYDGDYVGVVSPRADRYTCVYSWDKGAQQAPLAIPVLIPNVAHIQSPSSRAFVQTPGPGAPGLTLTYAPAGIQAAQVSATASDYNQRTATSQASADRGAVTIASSAFPSVFSVGWGTLTLTRAASMDNMGTVGPNAAFAQANLNTYEQVDMIPVFWD